MLKGGGAKLFWANHIERGAQNVSTPQKWGWGGGDNFYPLFHHPNHQQAEKVKFREENVFLLPGTSSGQ